MVFSLQQACGMMSHVCCREKRHVGVGKVTTCHPAAAALIVTALGESRYVHTVLEL
jgi:hypothetical protein